MKVNADIDPVAFKKYRDNFFADLEKNPFSVGVGKIRPMKVAERIHRFSKIDKKPKPEHDTPSK